jgi:hypothetical protein
MREDATVVCSSMRDLVDWTGLCCWPTLTALEDAVAATGCRWVDDATRSSGVAIRERTSASPFHCQKCLLLVLHLHLASVPASAGPLKVCLLPCNTRLHRVLSLVVLLSFRTVTAPAALLHPRPTLQLP